MSNAMRAAVALTLCGSGAFVQENHAEEAMNTTTTFRIEQQSTVPMLVADRPYEDFQIGCVNVIREGKVWHMWYSAYDHNYKTDADGRTWERVGREPKIPLGQGFDSKSIYVGPGAVPGDKPGTWWIYYAGYTAGHDDQYQTKVQHLGGIGRFLLVEEGPNQ